MRIRVRVQPRARETRVEELEDGTLKVKVPVPPVEGKANEAVVAALARHFGVPKSQVRIVSGKSSRNKLAEVGG